MLRWADNELQVTFDVECDRRGAVTVRFVRIMETPESAFLRQIFHSKGPHVEEFALEGVTADGSTFESESMYFIKYGFSYRRDVGRFTEPLATGARISVVLPEDASTDSTRVAYRLPGLRCFRTPLVETDFGKVWLLGEHSPDCYDILNSALIVDGTETDPPALEELDRRVERILRVLSVGSGRWIQWSAREVFSPGEKVSIVLLGPRPSSDPAYPLIHHLNWQPALRVAAEVYAKKAEGETGLGLTVAWMLMNPHFTEGEFVAGMTALEHLCDLHRQARSASLMDKTAFKEHLRPRLENALREGCAAAAVSEEVEQALFKRIRELNYRSLLKDLLEFLEWARVPLDDLDEDIPKLVRLRNNLVHRGSPGEKDDLSQSGRVLRELLGRVVLSLLDYRGQYISFIEGYQARQFARRATGGA